MVPEVNRLLVLADLRIKQIKHLACMIHFSLLCLIILSGCNFHLQTKSFSESSDSNIQHPKEIILSDFFTLVFEIPIRKGSLLENSREDNWEFPKDLIVHNDSLYILSSEEKRIIGYSKINNEFFRYIEIEKVLDKERYIDVSICPIYLNIISNFIIVGYDYRILVFSKKTQSFLYSINTSMAINKITFSKSEMFLWLDGFVEVYSLHNNSYEIISRISYPDNDLGFSEIIVSFKENIATQTSYYYFSRNNLIKEDILSLPHDIFPTCNKESFSLNCITSKFFVWYPWSLDSSLILINKESGKINKINIGFPLTKNNLSYEEDRENGLKIVSDDKYIYFLIMNLENDCKMLKMYQFDLASSGL